MPYDAAGGFDDFDEIMERRREEADAFYAALQNDIADPDARLVQRQALAGMLWSKQFYYFDIPEWLRGDPLQPPPPAGRQRAATPIGSTSTMPTSSRCRTNGSIRGTRPGTWPFTASRWRRSMPISPRTSSCC